MLSRESSLSKLNWSRLNWIFKEETGILENAFSKIPVSSLKIQEVENPDAQSGNTL